MAKQAPDAPDYEAAAAQQAQSSREVTEQQTWANRPDQVTPFGTQSWGNEAQWDPSTQQWLNRWTQTTELNPLSQDALDSQLAVTRDRSQLASSLTGRMQDEFGQPLDWNNFSATGAVPNVPEYGQGLPGRGQGPRAGQYSPEDVQRGLSTEGMQNVDPSQRYSQEAEDAIYGRFSSRMEPKFQEQEDASRARMYAQGLREGDQAFGREMDDLSQQQNDARQQAQYQATIGAGEEASRMYGMDSATRAQQFGERQGTGAFYNQAADQSFRQNLGAGGQQFSEGMSVANLADTQRQQAGNEQLQFGQAGFGQNLSAANYQNQLRQQQIAESLQQRGYTLNEINAMLTGQQVGMPSMPTFNTAGRAEGNQALQAAQMTGQAELDRFNAQQQATQGMMSGAGSMAMMMSDRRLKTNIKRIGSVKGRPLYSFLYIWGEPGVGVMSDEVADIPGAVHRHSSGYDMVDYGVIYG